MLGSTTISLAPALITLSTSVYREKQREVTEAFQGIPRVNGIPGDLRGVFESIADNFRGFSTGIGGVTSTFSGVSEGFPCATLGPSESLMGVLEAFLEVSEHFRLVSEALLGRFWRFRTCFSCTLHRDFGSISGSIRAF